MFEEKKLSDEAENKANEVLDKIKALVKEGNVTRIIIKKNDTIVLNLPMTVGVVGTVLGVAAAPWALILAAIATLGLDCTVEIEDKNGETVVIHGKESDGGKED